MNRTAEANKVRSLIEHWANAVRAKDMEGVLANHTVDVVMFDVPMPLQCKGIAEYRKTCELFFEHNDAGPGSFDIVELQVIASDSVAYAHALVKIFDSTVRVTIGLRKEQGRWLFAHEHHSYPIDL
jgi:uncharacterized protein (TIGR02246 family)